MLKKVTYDTVPDFLPKGDWLIISPSPLVITFGSCCISFEKGSILRSDGKGLIYSSVDKKTWTHSRPPIVNRNILNLNTYGRGYDRAKVYNTFVDSVVEYKELICKCEYLLDGTENYCTNCGEKITKN